MEYLQIRDYMARLPSASVRFERLRRQTCHQYGITYSLRHQSGQLVPKASLHHLLFIFPIDAGLSAQLLGYRQRNERFKLRTHPHTSRDMEKDSP